MPPAPPARQAAIEHVAQAAPHRQPLCLRVGIPRPPRGPAARELPVDQMSQRALHLRRRLRQEGRAEVEGARLLLEATAGHHHQPRLLERLPLRARAEAVVRSGKHSWRGLGKRALGAGCSDARSARRVGDDSRRTKERRAGDQGRPRWSPGALGSIALQNTSRSRSGATIMPNQRSGCFVLIMFGFERRTRTCLAGIQANFCTLCAM